MSELITQEETDRSVVPGVPGGLVMLHENFDYADEADQTISAAMHSDAAGHPREPPPHALNAADAARARASPPRRPRRARAAAGGGRRRGRGRRAGRRGGRGGGGGAAAAAAAHGRLARPARGALDQDALKAAEHGNGRARRVPHGRRPDGDEPPAHGLVAAPPRDRLRAHLGARRRDRSERPRRPRRDLPHAARARLRERLCDVREPAPRGGRRPEYQEQARRVHAARRRVPLGRRRVLPPAPPGRRRHVPGRRRRAHDAVHRGARAGESERENVPSPPRTFPL